MKMVTMGAWALGSLLGGLLTLSGEEVWMVDILKEHIDALHSNSLSIEDQGKSKLSE